MASTSEEERLKAEIAKLSGAIQTHKQQSYQQPYPAYPAAFSSRGRGSYQVSHPSSYRGAYTSSRGGFHTGANAGRGRGRGATPVPPRNRTLILNDTSNKNAASSATPSAAGSISKSGDTDHEQAAPSSAAGTTLTSSSTTPSSAAPTDGWIKRKSTHNMSLVSASTFQRTEPARLAALEATRKAKAAASSSASSNKPLKAKSKASSSVRRGDNMGEVVIDGVVFEFDPSGTKLVKKAVQPSSDPSLTSEPSSSTLSETVPLKTSINGQDYIRTKRGNLISADLLAKRKAQREAQAKMGRLDKMVGQISAIQATRNRLRPTSKTLDAKKARTLCTFFNKTGQCKRGLSCPYLHDSTKIALCPKVLRPTGCTLPAGTCPLSHSVRPERVPHCVHFLRMGTCRNGQECLYTHKKLTDGVRTKICREFSEYGWCERGRECEERHTYECPDFVEGGKCDRKGCKLVHVIRAQTSQAATGPDGDGGEGVQDGELFMRDDAAADEPSDAESEPQPGPNAAGKRKRPLMQTELDDDQVLPSDNDTDGDADEKVNFASNHDSRTSKRRKAKAFTQQKDFISFDDEEDPGESEDDAESEEESSDGEDQEDVDVASVHSEDFELSDGGQDESDDEEDEEKDEEEDTDPLQSRAEDDDDDDVVDRDL